MFGGDRGEHFQDVGRFLQDLAAVGGDELGNLFLELLSESNRRAYLDCGLLVVIVYDVDSGFLRGGRAAVDTNVACQQLRFVVVQTVVG